VYCSYCSYSNFTLKPQKLHEKLVFLIVVLLLYLWRVRWKSIIFLKYTLLLHHVTCILSWGCALSNIRQHTSQNHRITESQNHRMVGVERDLCGSSSSTPLPKQGHLEQAERVLVQAGLEYLKRSRIRTLFQCSVTLRVKKLFLMFRRNFLYFSLCPLPLVLSLGTTEKSLAPSS